MKCIRLILTFVLLMFIVSNLKRHILSRGTIKFARNESNGGINNVTKLKNAIKRTRRAYIPNITYSGMIKACKDEYPNSFPCTKYSLMENNFWNNSRIWYSWVLTDQNNCLGYTTNSTYVMGTCVNTMSNTYTMQCSCEEALLICCI